MDYSNPKAAPSTPMDKSYAYPNVSESLKLPKRDDSAFINMPKTGAEAATIGSVKSTIGTVKPKNEGEFIAQERAKELLKAKLEKEVADKKLADAKAKADAAEILKRKADAASMPQSENDINLSDPYGNKIPDYDTSGRAKMAESMLSQGIGGLDGKPAVPKTDLQKTAESMGAGYSNVGDPGDREPTEQEDKIPDSQAAIAVKTPASSAGEIANASPSRVGAIIDKLKAEEKKGGPNFFDIIEAATAGWNGRIPMYVQKELAAKEQEEALARMQAGADIDAANYTQRQEDELAAEKRRFSFDEAEAAKNRAFQLAMKDGTVSDGVGKLGGLSASGFLGGK